MTALVLLLLPLQLSGCEGVASKLPAPGGSTRAAVAPPLGTAQTFAVLGGSTVTNTGSSVITGSLGVSPGLAVTGFPPGLVNGGTIHAADAVALQAQADATAADVALASQACTTDLTGQDLGGLTLAPGVYCFSSSAQLTGTLTLDAGGDPAAVWVFRAGSSLTSATGASVRLTNGGQPCNVFWQVGSSATLGTTTTFVGHLIALTSITLNNGATVSGSVLARNGAVTLDSNRVATPVCDVAPATPAAPTLGQTFGPATITAGGVSTITITLSNPDGAVATLTGPFVQTLPAGLVLAAIPGATTTCGGALVATAGGSTVTLTGGAIPAQGSCLLTFDVSAASAGVYVNTIAAGALQTSHGSNAAAASATLTVGAPALLGPTLSKSFGRTSIAAGEHTTILITLGNPDGTIATLTAPLVDVLPAGLVVAGTGPQASNTCGGVFNPSTGDTTVTMTGGAIPANGSCIVKFDVYAATAGVYVNTIAAGALQTSNGSNAAAATATLTVGAPALLGPTLGKSFARTSITAGEYTTILITLGNPDGTIATLTAPLVDVLPTGLVVAGSGPQASNTCGGAFDPRTGDTTVTMTGGSIPANGSCIVKFDVYAATAGTYVNTLPAGALQTSQGSNVAPAVATLTVVAPARLGPTLEKSFARTSILAGEYTTILITLGNPDGAIATLTAPLVDVLPAGLVVAGSGPQASNTCGAAFDPLTGDTTVTMTGGSIPAHGSCIVRFDVYAAHAGVYVNTLPAGALQTSQGSNAAPAVATLTVR